MVLRADRAPAAQSCGSSP